MSTDKTCPFPDEQNKLNNLIWIDKQWDCYVEHKPWSLQLPVYSWAISSNICSNMSSSSRSSLKGNVSWQNLTSKFELTSAKAKILSRWFPELSLFSIVSFGWSWPAVFGPPRWRLWSVKRASICCLACARRLYLLFYTGKCSYHSSTFCDSLGFIFIVMPRKF